MRNIKSELFVLLVAILSTLQSAYADDHFWSGITTDEIAGEEGDGTMGVSFVDIDSDGDDDLVIANGSDSAAGGPTKLFINDGSGNFTDESFGPFTEDHRVWQTIFGDMDNDGDSDMFWICFGEQCRLFENCNGGTLFLEVDGPWSTAGNAGNPPIPGNLMARGGAWVDYNMDGLLDLTITTNGSHPLIATNKLYQNVGRNPKTGEQIFIDATPDVWLPPDGEEGIIGRGIAWSDFDNDGDLDLYAVGAKGCPCPEEYPDDWSINAQNQMWRNDGLDKNGETIFTEVMIDPDWDGDGEPDSSRHGRGVAPGDYDNDGDIDLYIDNVGLSYSEGGEIVWEIPGPNRLLENKLIDGGIKNPKNAFVFEDVTPNILLLEGGERSPSWFDMDNDGDLDLVTSNMWEIDPNNPDINVRNIALFENINNGEDWSWVTDDVFLQEEQAGDSGMGLAISDIDDDGDLDMAATWKFAPNLLLQNELDNENHWIKIKLEGSWYPNNRGAVGARIEVISGSLTQTREVATGTGYWTQHSAVQHIGLGDHNAIDEIIVKWPSGDVQYVYPCVIDETIYILENQPQDDDCAEDINNDCKVNVEDILVLISTWGNCENCSADLNSDSNVGIEDLLMVIAAWGDCP